MSTEQPSDKRIVRGPERIIILIVFAIFTYVLVSKYGCNFLYQSEETEVIQRPHD